MRVGYLGPPGTFSEEAVGRCELVATAERRDYPTIADAFEAVAKGEVDCGLLPIENSLEGSVNVTLDMLVHRPGLRIKREVLLPIRSEEHTSELQSRVDLVCRRLLEKKEGHPQAAHGDRELPGSGAPQC